jgi:hypothetical protein
MGKRFNRARQNAIEMFDCSVRLEEEGSLYRAHDTGECCGRACCQSCIEAYRDWLIEEVHRLRLKSAQLVAVTIALPRDEYTESRMQQLSIANSKRSLRRLMTGAGFGQTPIIGIADTAFEEWGDRRYESFWSLHWHLTMKTDVEPKAVTSQIR